MMNSKEWHIYLKEIPWSEQDRFWVSFESDPKLEKTRSDIYGKCLPCIQNLYYQLKQGCDEITLGAAYNCWKVIAVLKNIDECLALLNEFEKQFPHGHVHGKFGTGRAHSETKVVVFHAEFEEERDRINNALSKCLPNVSLSGSVLISRACGILYDDILGDWRNWQPITAIQDPENVNQVLTRIEKALFWSRM